MLILVGTNPVVSHGHGNGIADPVRRLRAQQERGPVWVIDPRRTETARLADRHLPPAQHRLSDPGLAGARAVE